MAGGTRRQECSEMVSQSRICRDMRQLLLWVIEDAESHLIEIHYLDGSRRVIDTANPEDREAFSDMNVLFAGFVERRGKECKSIDISQTMGK
jgi:hypothetical protein